MKYIDVIRSAAAIQRICGSRMPPLQAVAWVRFARHMEDLFGQYAREEHALAAVLRGEELQEAVQQLQAQEVDRYSGTLPTLGEALPDLSPSEVAALMETGIGV